MRFIELSAVFALIFSVSVVSGMSVSTSSSSSNNGGTDNSSGLSCSSTNGKENCSVNVNGEQKTGLTRAEAEALVRENGGTVPEPIDPATFDPFKFVGFA